MGPFSAVWKLYICGVIVIFLTCDITGLDGQCNQTANGVRRFGEKCNYRCHCVTDEQCDFSTGACTSGCDFSWTGPGCQYKNIALKEECRHSDNLPYPRQQFADLANDQHITTCSSTGDEHTPRRTRVPWWALWFPQQKTFSEFVFMTGDNFLAYLPGFRISVQQNVTDQQHRSKAYLTGTTCYQHDLSIPPNKTVHVKCNRDLVGNQLRIQLANTSTQLVLCDVRVYSECKDRTWGQPCQQECGLCQNLEECDTSYGHCYNGCELGYKNTILCDQECDLGTYGVNCLGKCNNCKKKICHRETGVCSEGCNPGYIGEKCEDSCSNGYFGEDCNSTCTNCAKRNGKMSCNNVDGTCFNGCNPGWKGDLCMTECDLGTYGLNCSGNCNNCKKNICNRETGVCSEGCNPGYIGEKCEDSCSNGYFGEDCNFPCTNCAKRNGKMSCDNVNGTCLNGCNPGWKGDLCMTVCESGKWGTDCSENCGKCASEPCNRFNGICTGGCIAGYKNTDLCIEECGVGTYGVGCQRSCSDNCAQQRVCNNIDGNCNGCQAGWVGMRCDKVCESGKWGTDCSENCGKCALEPCNRFNGTCTGGCIAGYKSTDLCLEECGVGKYGVGCQRSCSDNCVQQGVCNNIDGNCNGCQAGWVGVRCDKVCESGKWGTDCSQNCGKCASEPCNRFNGSCTGGCIAGYKSTDLCIEECGVGKYGIGCEGSCSDNCVEQRVCNKTDGNCNGCQAGWMGMLCDKVCESGKWGTDCSRSCGKCASEPCNRFNGTCTGGCIAGYKSTDLCLEECGVGKYGIGCQGSCSDNCVEQRVCNKTDGNCNGCQAGWMGMLCDRVCESGKWGTDCSENCGKCASEPCNRFNGTCTGGCIAGYKSTDLCLEECGIGKYGIGCQGSCSDNCVEQRVCNKTDGNCNGCQAGWMGMLCDRECESGKWGNDCLMDCGNCATGPCNKFDGTCVDDCMPGYKASDLCVEECEHGTYGLGCQNNCSEHCLTRHVCDRTDGNCHGCQAGWLGEQCKKRCQSGFYGEDCSEKCGACTGNMTCNHVHGKCSDMCKPGFEQTDLCKTKCPDGTFGFNCSHSCGKCKLMLECNKETGVCDTGCVDGFTGTLCVEKETPIASFSVAAVAGGLSAALVAGVIGLIVIVLFRRRTLVKTKGNASSNSDKILTQDTDVDSKDHGGRRPSSNERVPSPASGHEVHIADLQEYVKTNLEDNEYLINQFKELPYGMQFPSTAATKRENVIKNKYKAMYAYDHSRVVLKPVQGGTETDYINASYIKGHNGEISYIAAQGPVTRSLDDFWMMIWEQDIRTIVMVTNIIEEGKRKCEQYWPEAGKSVQHGQISVSIESEDEFAEFTIRHMKMYRECESDNCKAVTHFHYKVWPDKSVPRCPSSLLHFWYQVRKHDARKTIPWLVHCSAGVGRTGTFIAVDILYDQGKDNGVVDIYRCIRDLREQRVNMVQTKDQYKFIHTIMLEAFVLPWKPVIIDTFSNTYAELKSVDRATGSRKTRLLLQFESLNEETECGIGYGTHTNLNYTASEAIENRNKNRYEYILAPNEFRPFLYTQVQGCTDYINAIYLPGYRRKHGYIITQTPLKNTEVDYCRLIVEEEIKIIVAFEDNGDEKVGKYLPEKGSLDIGPFSIACMSEEDQPLFIKRQYELQFNARKHTITQIVFKKWLQSKLTPSNPNEMLCFVQELEHLQRQTENEPVLVQCWNGATRSGLIVVLMNILERVRFDGEVSVTHVIRQLKSHRQQILPNFEQFKFCHDVLLAHVLCDSTYANM